VPRPARLQSAYDEAVTLARDALGDTAFTTAQMEGAALRTERAVAEALAGAAAPN
jgi:hypothetical protein